MSECEPRGASGVPRWARGRFVGTWAQIVWLVPLLSEPMAHATEAGHPWLVWLLLAVVAGTFSGLAVLSSLHFDTAGTPAQKRLAYLLLALEAVAVVVVVAGSPESQQLVPLLTISAVVTLDARRGLWGVAATTALGAGAVIAGGGTGDQWSSTVLIAVLSGAGCWSFRRLFIVIVELRRTQEELARVAVVRERERFSRDLHDLLGHTLSVIVVKAQAVRRIAELDPAVAVEQAGDIETIGRRALTEVRQAVEGYAGTGLAAEVERAREALTSAGVSVSVAEPDDGGTLPEGVDALFGWVVREGSTNVLRHAAAATCRISWSLDGPAARLSIEDDGQGAVAAGSGGHGLTGLRERVAAAGGRLETTSAAGGGFRLAVEVPVGVRETVRS